MVQWHQKYWLMCNGEEALSLPHTGVVIGLMGGGRQIRGLLTELEVVLFYEGYNVLLCSRDW